MSRSSLRQEIATIPAVTLIIGVMSLLLTACATEDTVEWQGRFVEQESLLVVENPGKPIEPPATINLEELWRIGGDTEDEDQFFGLLMGLLVDDEGRVYLLDKALHEIKVFSSDGEFLRTLGREGEGPGEFRRPEAMAFLPGDTIAVMERVPGRIILLTSEGEPAGEHPLPKVEGAGFVGIAAAASDRRNLHLVLGYDNFEQGRYRHIRQISELNRDGTIKTVIAENERGFEFANPLIRERIWDDFDNRWAIDDEGRVYVAMSWDEFRVDVWSSDGVMERIVKRPQDARKRSAEEKTRYEAIYKPFLQQLPNAQIEIEDHDHPIVQVYAAGDGWFWVQTCHGAFDRPDGSLGTFDLFDNEGRFVQQVTLMGEGDPLRDAFGFIDDRLYVLKGLLDAQLSAQGGASEEAGADELEPMSVICYRLNHPSL